MYFIESAMGQSCEVTSVYTGRGKGARRKAAVDGGAHIRSKSQNPLLSVRATSGHSNGDDNDDGNDNCEDAEDQRADVEALGSGGVGLGSSHITHHLPVPGLEQSRLSVALLWMGKCSDAFLIMLPVDCISPTWSGTFHILCLCTWPRTCC